MKMSVTTIVLQCKEHILYIEPPYLNVQEVQTCLTQLFCFLESASLPPVSFKGDLHLACWEMLVCP